MLLEDSRVKREWDRRKKIELLGVANFDISFKLLASLPFLLSKEESSKNYLFWPAWSTAPFAPEESETLHPQLKKTKTPKLLGEKFHDTFSQLLLEESRVLWGVARTFLQVAKHVTLLHVTE